MMKNFFYILIAFPAFLSAQTLNQAAMTKIDMNNLTPATSIITYDLSESGIQGSPFFIETYQEGSLWTSNNTHYTQELQYRFDGVENSVQIKYKDSGKEVLLFKNNVERLDLMIEGKAVSFIKVPEIDGNDVHKLYQVLYLGKKFKVVKLFRKKLVKETSESHGFDPDKNHVEYKENNLYYIKMGNKDFIPFQNTKKGLIKILPAEEKKLEAYFSTVKFKKDLPDIRLAELILSLDDLGK